MVGHPTPPVRAASWPLKQHLFMLASLCLHSEYKQPLDLGRFSLAIRNTVNFFFTHELAQFKD